MFKIYFNQHDIFSHPLTNHLSSSSLFSSDRSHQKNSTIHQMWLIYSYDPDSTSSELELGIQLFISFLPPLLHNTNYTANFANPSLQRGKKSSLLGVKIRGLFKCIIMRGGEARRFEFIGGHPFSGWKQTSNKVAAVRSWKRLTALALAGVSAPWATEFYFA